MIWFGNLERIFEGGEVPPGLPRGAEFTRMQMALERVAELSPGLSGNTLVEAIASTGWVDRGTALRLLPHFRFFDPDRHFAEYLRRLSFRGRMADEDFRGGVRYVVEEIAGSARIDRVGPASCVRYSNGPHEGIILAQPEVAFTLGGPIRDGILAAIEEMPDALVVVARSFDRVTAEQLGSLLRRTGIPGTLITVNLLLGIRATALRYQPGPGRVISVLARGGALRSTDIATLGDRAPSQTAA
jgi:hypothetical protein